MGILQRSWTELNRVGAVVVVCCSSAVMVHSEAIAQVQKLDARLESVSLFRPVGAPAKISSTLSTRSYQFQRGDFFMAEVRSRVYTTTGLAFNAGGMVELRAEVCHKAAGEDVRPSNPRDSSSNFVGELTSKGWVCDESRLVERTPFRGELAGLMSLEELANNDRFLGHLNARSVVFRRRPQGNTETGGVMPFEQPGTYLARICGSAVRLDGRQSVSVEANTSNDCTNVIRMTVTEEPNTSTGADVVPGDLFIPLVEGARVIRGSTLFIPLYAKNLGGRIAWGAAARINLLNQPADGRQTSASMASFAWLVPAVNSSSNNLVGFAVVPIARDGLQSSATIKAEICLAAISQKIDLTKLTPEQRQRHCKIIQSSAYSVIGTP